MKLTLEGLNDKEGWKKAGVALPSYDIRAVRAETAKNPAWVHFGAGNIFRMFIGGIADTLLEKGLSKTGIVCAESFSFDMINEIYRPYDNLVLGVTLKPDGGVEKRVVASLSEAVASTPKNAESWSRMKQVFASPSLQMVSFTITEKGYALRNSSGAYFPHIASDIESGPDSAESAMAQVTALLFHRFRNGAYPIAVVSMDNCSHNGEKLKEAVVDMSLEWLGKGFVGDDFVEYIKDEGRVSFPWTMIDKITPRPSVEIGKMLEDSGIEDMQPFVTEKKTFIAPFVNAEGPQYLVVEDRFPNGRPPLEEAGVYMTDRATVNSVERMKVTTCLNPLHTALAVYGCLLGYNLIADEMKDAELAKLVRRIGLDEGMPVVTDPKIISPQKFVDEVINTRLPNPFVPDTPQRIACDTSQKVGIRFGETIKSYVEKYGDASFLNAIPLAIAGWCRYLLAVDDSGKPFEVSPDPMLEELNGRLKGVVWNSPDSYSGQLSGILSDKGIFGVDLYEVGLGEKIESIFKEELSGAGSVRAALKNHLK